MSLKGEALWGSLYTCLPGTICHPRDSMCGTALAVAHLTRVACGWPVQPEEPLGRTLEAKSSAGTSYLRDLSSAAPLPSAGVDLSSIVKAAPKASVDSLQEPTHDVLQVGAAGSLSTTMLWRVFSPRPTWQKSGSECQWSVHLRPVEVYSQVS